MDNSELGTNLAEVGTDCISRQQAIEALERAKQNIHHNIERAIGDAVCEVLDAVENGIKQLPPANCSEIPNNSDTISRQDAVSRRRLLSDLKELITAWEKYPVMAEQIKGVEVAIGYVELIPSAQQERKKGKWIEVDDYYNRISGRCSVCGWEALLYETDVVGMDFCPNCGADMRGEHDE